MGASVTASPVLRALGVWVKGTLGRLKLRPWDLYLERPGAGAQVGGIVNVAGWAICRTAPVIRVEVWLGDRPPVEAASGLARPDVVAAYPHDSVSDPGFSGRIIVTETGPQTLSVRATAADGS